MSTHRPTRLRRCSVQPTRVLALVWLACVLSLPASAEHVGVRDIVEVSAPDGTAQAQSLVLLDDGTSALSVRGPLGDWAVLRMDAEGQEVARWAVPEDVVVAPTLALTLGEDGAAAFVATRSGIASLYAIGPDGIAAPPLPLGNDVTATGLPHFTPEGYAIAVSAGGIARVHAYDHLGALRAAYQPALLPQTLDVGVYIESVLADGGLLVDEQHRVPGGSRTIVRRLDAQLAVAWTQDFAGTAAASAGLMQLTAHDTGQVLAVFTQGGLGHMRPMVVHLDAKGAIAAQATASDWSGLEALRGYWTATGFDLFGVRWQSALWQPACRYEASFDGDGSLAGSCTLRESGAYGGLAAAHEVADGIDVLLSARGPDDVRFERHARRAATPHSMRVLQAPGLGSRAVASLTGGSTAAAGQSSGDEAVHRLLRWDAFGSMPTVNVLLPAADARHVTLDVARDDDAGVTIVANTERHADLVRIAADGSETRWRSPGSAHIANQLADATDGRARLLLSGPSVRLTSLERDASPAWTHDIAAHPGSIARLAMAPDASALVAYVPPSGDECRVRRVMPDGTSAGDSMPFGEGGVVLAATLESGAIFACQVNATQFFVRVDHALTVTPIPADACGTNVSSVQSLGGDRWATLGPRPDGDPTLRVCTFDGADFVHFSDVAFPVGSALAPFESFVRTDGAGHMHFVTHEMAADRIEHIDYDAHANALERHVVYDGGRSLQAIAGPDHRGRFAYLTTGFGEPTRAELKYLGQPPQWSVPLTAQLAQPKMALAGGRLVIVGTDQGEFDHVALRVAEVFPDLIFDEGFE